MIFISLFLKRQKMSFKEFQLAVVCSGRAATGFAAASAIPSLRSGQCRRFASLTAALRIPHANLVKKKYKV
jgi:hypothetical protein